MISGLSGGASDYFRSTATSSSKTTLTRADALPDVPKTTDSGANRHRIAISELKPLIATPVSAADTPELRDLMASNWLTMRNAPDPATVVPDNAPQNTYATVKVNGKVVATLYNGGSSMMTNDAAAAVSELQDPPGLSGPNLAQWRADKYAQLLGGTVEKASTAITQPQWTPRESRSTSYSREQLDAAFQAMLAEGQRTTAQGSSSYQPPQPSQGRQTDLSA